MLVEVRPVIVFFLATGDRRAVIGVKESLGAGSVFSCTCSDAFICLHQLDPSNERFSIDLTVIDLPEHSGRLELCQVRCTCPHVPVYITTKHGGFW